MLRMSRLTKTYRTDQVETRALHDFSLEVKAGEFVAVTGPSGSGKSTFLNIAGLLENFDSGSYELDGRDVSGLADDDRSLLRNAKIGFIFQGFNLLPDLSIYDNIDVPLRYRRMQVAERRRRIDKSFGTRRASRSQATHTRATIGRSAAAGRDRRALVGEPAFLLADEPTGNLDSTMAAEVLTLLEEINIAGTTIVLVTHDLQLSQRAKRNLRIVDGQIVSADLSTTLPAPCADLA